MKIKILGSGSAYGTPMCFNNWGNIKHPDHPYNRRSRFCVYLEENGQSLLVDMGPEFRLQTIDNHINNIDTIFLTHGHYDHIGGVPELFRAAKILNKNLHVYLAPETLEEVQKCYGYMFSDFKEDGKNQISWKLIHKGQNQVDSFALTCMEFPHNHMHSWGFRYKNVAIITDYEEISKENLSLLHGLDLLILECNNGTIQFANGHCNWIKIQPYLEEIRPKQTILTHLSAKVDYVEFKKILPENVDLAYDGMVVEL